MDDLATQYWRKICGLEKRLNGALRRIDTLESEAKEKDRIIALQKERIEELEDENRKLKGNAKKLKGIVFKENTKSGGRGNNRGAKKGHRASFRKKPETEDIDRETETLLSACPECSCALGGPVTFSERFSYDIPVPAEPVITRHLIAQYHCGKCGKWVQGLPSGLIPRSPFSINVIMAVLHMKYRGRATDDHIQETFKTFYGLHIADGTVHKILDRAAKLFGLDYEAVRQAIAEGKYVHADETGWRVNGGNWYTWGFVNEKAVYYTIESTRGGGIAEKVLRDFRGVVIRDGYQGYDRLKNEHQLCWPHLLRHTHHAADTEGSSVEMRDLHENLVWFLRSARKKHRKCRSPDERTALHGQMTIAAERFWKNITYGDREAEKIRRWWLEKRHMHLLTFLKYDYVKWHNNDAERALRPMVVRRKIAGGSRSERGAEREAVNMSCIETLIRQGKSIFREIPLIFQQALVKS